MNPNQFTSDNYSGICPEALTWIEKANQSHDLPYGEDKWTNEVCDLVREVFETDCEVFFVYNGTAANSLSLASMCSSYHSIICSEIAHIETDECGAPEFYSGGSKLLLAGGTNGKMNPSNIEELIVKRQDIHYPKPKVVSLTQTTELGTIYQPKELLEIYKVTKKHNLKIHMDGARFANAVAALDTSPKELSWQCGVDVLCFGGTKNGLPVGEIVIFFNKDFADEFAYRCKQSGQLASKMRFISAPWIGLLKDEVWKKNARNANDMTAYLEEKLKDIPEISFKFPREANALFINLPEEVPEKLDKLGWRFYSFIGRGGIRMMCNWDTKKETVDQLVNDLKGCL